MAVSISRPTVGTGCECLPLLAACLDAELLTQVVETVPQYFGIEVSWSSALDVGTRPIEGHQKLSVLSIYPVAMRPVPKKANDRWFPIDESPVDVECNSVEIANPKVHNPVSPRDDDIGDMIILLVGHATREHRLKLINFQGDQLRLRRLSLQTSTPRAREMLVIPCEALLALLPHKAFAAAVPRALILRRERALASEPRGWRRGGRGRFGAVTHQPRIYPRLDL